MVQGRRRHVVAALFVALVMPVGIGTIAAPVSAAPAPCKVVNVRTAVSTSKLQVALDAAAAGDTLRITGTCTGSFTIGDGYPDARKLTLIKGATAATLKGNGGRVLEVRGGTIKLTGIKITGGTADDCPTYPEATDQACGAGIWNDARLTLTKVVITGNVVGTAASMQAAGGGLAITESGTARLVRSVVSGNSTAAAAFNGRGGGIASGGVLAVDRSTISNNVVVGAGDSAGGGVFLDWGSETTITRSAIAQNTATSAGANSGAGIYLEGTAAVTVIRSTLSGNDADGDGRAGAIHSFATGSSIKIIASTISGNRAYEYGAIQARGALEIRASTITRNTATFTGGIHVGLSLALVSSILAGNVGTDPTADQECSSAVAVSISGDHNVIGEANGCPDFLNGQDYNKVGTQDVPLDPKLGKLASNGGPTKTHALLAGSPAIKAGGKPCAVSGKDQRGVARPRPAGTACDVGAYERS